MSAGKFLQDTMESEMVVNSHLVMRGNFRARKNARKKSAEIVNVSTEL